MCLLTDVLAAAPDMILLQEVVAEMYEVVKKLLFADNFI